MGVGVFASFDCIALDITVQVALKNLNFQVASNVLATPKQYLQYILVEEREIMS
jgi:uncharacterized protein (DUF362 family)